MIACSFDASACKKIRSAAMIEETTSDFMLEA
jgi:hypothetical protein